MCKILYVMVLLSVFSCAKKKAKDQDKSQEKSPEQAAEEQAQEATLAAEKKHLSLLQAMKPEEFCSSLKFVALRNDGLNQDLGLLCRDEKPTELFSNLIKNPYRGEGAFEKFNVSTIEEQEQEKSAFFVAFSQKIPKLTATQIREAAVNKVLLKGVDLELYKLTVEEVSDTPGDGLNFQRIVTRYKTLVKGPQSTEFRNERLTESNQYQVTVKREDLALSTEHLVVEGASNPNYDWARTITVTIGDPIDGGSFLISIVNFKTWNQGFHKVNTRALEAITKANAQMVFDALLAKSKS